MSVEKSKIISIAGESGVGKSTVSDIISIFYKEDNCIKLSTDDLHKWDRKNKKWENFTHLNPIANNLDMGDSHIKQLLINEPIYRSIYNHDTGYFDPPIKIFPKPIIIIDGLHAFYTDFMNKNSDLKIFVDTDEDLRIHWKILRDTEERGYKYSVVLNAINKRKKDSRPVMEHQLNSADVIIKIETKNKILKIGNKLEKIELKITIINKLQKENNLFSFIEKYFEDFNQYINLCKTGDSIEFCQGTGGNISVKSEHLLMIKPSGTKIKDADISVIDMNYIEDSFESLSEVLCLKKHKKPSMETLFHIKLNLKYVIHLHPIYLLTILCLENSRDIINKIYDNYDHQYIEYTTPGPGIAKLIQNKNIIFLENHGIIISENDADRIIKLLNDINNIAKKYVAENSGTYFCDQVYKVNNYYFPDAFVFPNDDEIQSVNCFIDNAGSKIGKLRALNQSSLFQLENSSFEVYRKNK